MTEKVKADNSVQEMFIKNGFPVFPEEEGELTKEEEKEEQKYWKELQKSLDEKDEARRKLEKEYAHFPIRVLEKIQKNFSQESMVHEAIDNVITGRRDQKKITKFSTGQQSAYDFMNSEGIEKYRIEQVEEVEDAA